MALTKPEYWLIAIGFVVIISFALLLFGNSLQDNDNITLDNDSTQYIKDYTSQMGITKMNETANDNADEKDLSNPILSSLGNIPIISDILGVFSFIGKILSGFWDFFSILFSLPSFFLSSFGIDLIKTKFIVNVLVNIFFLAGIIMLVRLGK